MNELFRTMNKITGIHSLGLDFILGENVQKLQTSLRSAGLGVDV